ncbi:hypothetical protein MJO28_015177 [Puccinia striiformis f. sp. tritici]|uniref:Uncharacterized protein n=3 Tax=Puccinia striiformis TaxID=27350 RepID=A0A0L0VVK1_9BASI|nr:hypothetical protein MJO28_015177 [Puccinia striiformis f. sp. tritici]KNF03301.1 hypothetical protein PSTG_03569 [Puccinia striiformis f. sp. tritici PST-78]POW18595.1 hypothetical protein PSHT_05613 [Puccinia striiformis]
MAEIPDAPLAVSFIRPQHYEQGDEVVNEFKRLISKFEPLTSRVTPPVDQTTQPALSALSAAEMESQEFLLSDLDSVLLPLLISRLDFLGPLLLQPLSLIDDPEYTLNLISELQSEIEAAIDEIESILARVCPEPMPIPNRTNDHHLKALKSCRLYRLKTEFEKVCLVHICQCFGEAYEQVQQFGLSSLEYKNEYDVTLYRENLGDPWALAEESMELAIKQLKETEFDLIQDRWKPKILMFGTLIGILNDGLIPSTEPDTLPVQFRRESVMQLVRSLLPIIKLSRLLFVKLSKLGGIDEYFDPIYTEMNSDQLDSLSKSAGDVNESFHQLLALFVELEENDLEAFHPRQFVKIIKTLKSRFEAALYLLLLYLIPAIPNTDSQDQLKTWFIVWNNGFILAIQNFENVVESLVVTP